MTIEVSKQFSEPHILDWEHPDRLGVPHLVHKDLIAAVEQFKTDFIQNHEAGKEGDYVQEIPINRGDEQFILRMKGCRQPQDYARMWVDLIQIQDDSETLVGTCPYIFDNVPHFRLKAESLPGARVGELIRTVAESTVGVLRREFVGVTSYILFLLKRGYYPTHPLEPKEFDQLVRSQARKIPPTKMTMFLDHNPNRGIALYQQIKEAAEELKAREQILPIPPPSEFKKTG